MSTSDKIQSISIVIPTYNERENIKIFIPLLQQKFIGIPHEIIIVDDSSPDGTGKEVENIAVGKDNIILITQKEKKGIGAALRRGYNSAKNDIIISSDADLSFFPDDLEGLYKKIVNDGYDVVVGSRHSQSSRYEVPNFFIALKYGVSHFGNFILHSLFNIPIRDFSVNCRAIRRSTWSSLNTKEDTNFFLFEMLLLARRSGAKMGEVPVVFLDRKYGKSKINHIIEIPKAFLKMLLYLLRR